MLRALVSAGLVEVRSSGADGRRRVARLTPAGQAEWRALDERADELAGSILTALGPRQQERLIEAMAEVDRLLQASTVDLSVYDPRHPSARACIAAYVTELAERFDDGFNPDLSNPAGDHDLTEPAGLLVVATQHGEPVGCGALRLHGRRPAEIKRMWVAASARGLGLGRRILADLEQRAAARGVRTLRLETNRALTEAISLYRAAGYREVPAFNTERYAHHWFEKRIPS
jgi:GNAT superfamily N-acetyltransferase